MKNRKYKNILIIFFILYCTYLFARLDSIYNRISIIENYESICFYNPAYITFIKERVFIMGSTFYYNSSEFGYTKEYPQGKSFTNVNFYTNYNKIYNEEYIHPENTKNWGFPITVFIPFNKFVLGISYTFEQSKYKDIRKTKDDGKTLYAVSTNGSKIVPSTPQDYLYESVTEERIDTIAQGVVFLLGFKIKHNSIGFYFGCENERTDTENNNKSSLVTFVESSFSSTSASYRKEKINWEIRIGDIIELSSRMRPTVLINYRNSEYEKFRNDKAEYVSETGILIEKEKYKYTRAGGQLGLNYRYRKFLLAKIGYSYNYSEEYKDGINNNINYRIYTQKGYSHQIQLLLFLAISEKAVLGNQFIYNYDRIDKDKSSEKKIFYNKYFKIKTGLEQLITEKLILRLVLNQKYTKEDLKRETYENGVVDYRYKSDERIEGETYFTIGGGYKILKNFSIDWGITFNSKQFYFDLILRNPF